MRCVRVDSVMNAPAGMDLSLLAERSRIERFLLAEKVLSGRLLSA